ncbi:MAG: gfo/Idh/MocA family oxidoreductase, partial [Verrucomicrobiota bacterium]
PTLEIEEDLSRWYNGILFVGDGGMLLADYGKRKLFPADKFKDYQPPKPSIPKSAGHYREWLNAAKNGGETTCNFEYSGSLIEHNLLGNVAYRVGKKLHWNPRKLVADNAPEATAFIRRDYRDGWTI